ncbi:MAG: porin family protein [Deltaproteobacteria bacterium]|nr:porin family protein [Deltaproteobacteria bacterium]
MAPRIALLTCLLLLVAAPDARAQGGRAAPDYARSGWYTGAGFSVGFEAFSGIKEIEDNRGLNVTVGNAFGINARAGYRILPWLAVEGQFEWLSSFGYTLEDVLLPGETEPRDATLKTVEDYTFTFNAKGYPLTGRVQPFGLIGLGGMYAINTRNPLLFLGDLSVDTGGFVARFGGGVDYYLDPNWILTMDVSYLVTTGGVSDTNRTSLGIGFQYRF